MSKVTSRMRQIERRMARRRGPGQVYVCAISDYDDPNSVRDFDGRRWSLAEWEAAHPDVMRIHLVWGDGETEVPLTNPIPADVWDNV